MIVEVERTVHASCKAGGWKDGQAPAAQENAKHSGCLTLQQPAPSLQHGEHESLYFERKSARPYHSASVPNDLSIFKRSCFSTHYGRLQHAVKRG